MTNEYVNIETGRNQDYQLYNVKTDPGQQNNQAKSHPEKLEELKLAFDKEKI